MVRLGVIQFKLCRCEMSTDTLIQKILSKYRGLRKEDLPQGNIEYACVICGNEDCPNCGQPNKCCHNCTPITEEQFAKRYKF